MASHPSSPFDLSSPFVLLVLVILIVSMVGPYSGFACFSHFVLAHFMLLFWILVHAL